MCGSHWFVNQLLLKAVLLQFSPFAGTEVWEQPPGSVTTPCWEKVVITSHAPSCSQWLNHIVFWPLQPHGSQRDDCLFCQSSNFKYFYSFYLLMPSCEHSPTARPFLQNMTATPTKIVPKTCFISLLPAPKVRQGEGSSCCPSLTQHRSPPLPFLHQQLTHSKLATLTSLGITVYALPFQQLCYK